MSCLRADHALIWSNLCTRHIPNKLTPRGHDDWPDKQTIRQLTVNLGLRCAIRDRASMVHRSPSHAHRITLRGNVYESSSCPRREQCMADRRRSATSTRPQSSAGEDACKRHLLYRRAPHAWTLSWCSHLRVVRVLRTNPRRTVRRFGRGLACHPSWLINTAAAFGIVSPTEDFDLNKGRRWQPSKRKHPAVRLRTTATPAAHDATMDAHAGQYASGFVAGSHAPQRAGGGRLKVAMRTPVRALSLANGIGRREP
jgi:hypothetical protein